jgi:hypothetical protein
MRKTNTNSIVTEKTLLVDTPMLAADVLHCGTVTAVKIGTEAGARVQMGKRVLWNLKRIENYVNAISE